MAEGTMGMAADNIMELKENVTRYVGLASVVGPVWKLLVLCYQFTCGLKSVDMKGGRPWNADESSVSGNCYRGYAVAIENTTLKKT
ncbi:hypothetical protein OUZ56_028640 [Daphnia magna]|uniref:Uncharacterized protein n=1 Tax=Daphnia magna TaxID=35525 RepID=A0ABR0B4G4_9CRUS|nr:hypothetical protein OUZ56_028637 [Daphnia magna]KAK4036594.1 hypothetical protein OUZ56_028640 [Daphnia magna]